MKPKVKYFLTAVTFLFYILQEYYLDKNCVFLQGLLQFGTIAPVLT